METRDLYMMLPAAALALLLSTTPGDARDFGIFVDGSYSPGGAQSQMDRLIDQRIDQAKQIFDSRHPNGQSQRVESEADFKKAMSLIACGEGETLTIVMMGHGERNSFKFTKEGKSLSAQELRDALVSATVGCKCQIHIVIFSCHSGSFMDDLFKDVHVQSVYTSCRADEKSSSFQDWVDGKLLDGGDWMRGFNEDWASVPPDASLADAVEAASRSAKEKLPPGGTQTQHPQGWRRGLHSVKAHVESVTKSRERISKIRVHFYLPEFLRCTQEWVELEPGVMAPADLKYCEWIEFQASVGSPNDSSGKRIRATGDISRTTAPTETIVAHVEEVDRDKGLVRVAVIEPKWMFGTRRIMKIEDALLDPSVQPCNWIEQTVSVNDPDGDLTTRESVSPDEISFSVKAHVEGNKNLGTGRVSVHILQPAFLRCNRVDLQLPPEEWAKLANVNRCDNIQVVYDANVSSGGTHRGVNLQKALNNGDPEHYYNYDMAIGSLSGFSYTYPEDELLPPFEKAGIITPQIMIYNAGQNTMNPGLIRCRIMAGESKIQQDYQEWPPLSPGESWPVVFQDWAPKTTGMYHLQFEFVDLDDENFANNAIQVTTEAKAMRPVISRFAVDPATGHLRLEFQTITPLGSAFVLEATSSLSGGIWKPDAQAALTETPLGYRFEIPPVTSAAAIFYRIQVLPPAR